MTPEPLVSLTVARSDRNHVAFLASLNNPDAGVVAARMRPGTHSFGRWAMLLNAALGVREDVSGAGRNDHERLRYLVAKLIAHQIRHVVVTGAEVLPPAAVSSLVDFVHQLGVRLWLVCDHELPEQLLEGIEGWPVAPISQEDFDRHWKAAHPSPDSRQLQTVPFPLVPQSDFATFKADITRLLDPDQARIAVAAYERHLNAADMLIAEADFTDEAAVATALRRQIATCPTASEMTVAMRAFQSAAFAVGWFVQVDLANLLATGDHQVTAAAQDPDTWQRLRAYRPPWRGAVCAVLSAGIRPDDLTQITCADVAPTGSEIVLDGTPYPVPAGAEPLVLGHLIDRIGARARPQDPYFANDDGSPIRHYRLTYAVGDAARDLDVAVIASRTVRPEVGPRLWRNRRGISIIDIR